MNSNHAFKLVQMLTAAWPSWKPSKDTVELYVGLLQRFPEDVARHAIEDLIISDVREFAPPIGVVINKIAQRARIVAGRPAVSAEEAWGVVQDEIRFLGWYQGPGNLKGNPATQKAVAAIGWDRICHDENVAATRAHFFRIYEAEEQRTITAVIDHLTNGGALEALSPTRRLELSQEEEEGEDDGE